MHSRILQRLPWPAVAAVIVAVFLAGYGAGQASVARGADDQGFALLRQLLTHIRQDYLGPVPDARVLFDGAARGMLEALGDPYTRYMDARAFREFAQDAQGYFFGIGIFIDIRDGQLIVVQPIEGTPAHRAGLRPGDRIRAINNVSTEGMALQEAVSRIRGPAGTRVVLRIQRADRSFDVEITRARIQIVSVQGAGVLDADLQKQLAAERLGYVRILTFNDRTAEEVAAEMTRLQQVGVRGVLLDLRSNGGGLLEASLRVAERFVPEGRPLVHIVDRTGRKTTERAGRGPKIQLPVVVLVNEFSASASEILAGALKDSAGATLVGIRTFGKGVIQSVYALPGGGGAAITTSKYLTPADHDIHGKGVPPDVVAGDRLEGKSDAEVARIQQEQLRRAVEVLRQRAGRR
ncbi:MAG: S41 family peptidase [Armatimonadota bacterium]|nr:S41 family peptidase [Armatimonadota bacterium]